MSDPEAPAPKLKKGQKEDEVTRVAPLTAPIDRQDLSQRGPQAALTAVPIPEAHRRAAALIDKLFVAVPMTEEEKNVQDPDYGL